MRKDVERAYAQQRRIEWEMKANRIIYPSWVYFAVVMGMGVLSVAIRALTS